MSDARDLDRRLAAATPADTVRGLIFNAAFQHAREHGGAALAQRCDPEGKGSRVDFFAYPVTDFLRLSWALADALAPSPFDEVLWKIGHRAGSVVFSSLVGKTMAALAGLDTRQLVSQAPAGYRATVSYGERAVEWKGERHARIAFRRDFLVPPFHCGVMTGALQAVGTKGTKVEGAQTGFLEAIYDLTWQA
jgi:uncharacterized protein (TIGR02265 family)